METHEILLLFEAPQLENHKYNQSNKMKRSGQFVVVNLMNERLKGVTALNFILELGILKETLFFFFFFKLYYGNLPRVPVCPLRLGHTKPSVGLRAMLVSLRAFLSVGRLSYSVYSAPLALVRHHQGFWADSACWIGVGPSVRERTLIGCSA